MDPNIYDSDDESISSESGDMLNMFRITSPMKSNFYFKSIALFNNVENNSTQVLYTFSYGNKYDFQSKLVFPNFLSPSKYYILFNIGMCKLLWYWMGFGTEKIIIESYVMTNAMLKYWEEFYSELLLEFKYNHPSVGEIVLENKFVDTEVPTFVISQTPLFTHDLKHTVATASTSSSSSSKKRILCPLGGLHVNA